MSIRILNQRLMILNLIFSSVGRFRTVGYTAILEQVVDGVRFNTGRICFARQGQSVSVDSCLVNSLLLDVPLVACCAFRQVNSR